MKIPIEIHLSSFLEPNFPFLYYHYKHFLDRSRKLLEIRLAIDVLAIEYHRATSFEEEEKKKKKRKKNKKKRRKKKIREEKKKKKKDRDEVFLREEEATRKRRDVCANRMIDGRSSKPSITSDLASSRIDGCGLASGIWTVNGDILETHRVGFHDGGTRGANTLMMLLVMFNSDRCFEITFLEYYKNIIITFSFFY